MARHADFCPRWTKDGWVVSVPPVMTAAGRRLRRFFKEEKLALRFAKKLKAKYEAGLRGAVISNVQALDATEAMRVLEGSGISLVEAARMAVAAMKTNGAAAAVVFRDRWREAMRMGEAHWSDRYERDMEKIPKWLGEAGMRMRCSELGPAAIDELLRANGAKSPLTLKMRRARVLAAMNPKVRGGQRRNTEILTLAEAEKVLAAAGTQEERWMVALVLWAGIRPDAEDGEISRLQWEDVGKREIYVSPEVSKTNTDRHVPISPRLKRLLVGHPAEGPVRMAGWKRRWTEIRRKAGISKKQDVCRHTFASHLLAWKGEEATKQALGHTDDSNTLFRHYRRAVTKADGVAFFR